MNVQIGKNVNRIFVQIFENVNKNLERKHPLSDFAPSAGSPPATRPTVVALS